MTMEFFTTQSARNVAAEHLFMDGRYSTVEVGAVVGRPLWFQCDPPFALGGSVQRWLDAGMSYSEVVRRAAQVRCEWFLKRDSAAEAEPREDRERMFRRLRGGEFEVVVLEVWGREKLEDYREQGVALKGRFLQAMLRGLSAEL